MSEPKTIRVAKVTHDGVTCTMELHELTSMIGEEDGGPYTVNIETMSVPAAGG